MNIFLFARTLRRLVCAVILISAVPQAALAQFFIDGYLRDFTEFQLPEPMEYCFDAFNRWGDLSSTTDIGYILVPDPSHYTQALDYFAGFRRPSQPGKLWLLSRNLQWFEYRPGDMLPDSPPIAVSPNALPYFAIHGNWQRTLDLSGLIGDGELLVGYGLRTHASSSRTDAFQEMLDSQRFAVVWRIGDSTPGDEVCVEYNTVVMAPKGVGGLAN